MTTAQTLTPALSVTVYTTSLCYACKATKRQLDKLGIPYTEQAIDDEDNREAAIELGFTTAPVVLVDHPELGELSWDGHRPDRIDALCG